MTIKDLKALGQYMKLNQVCSQARINYHTLKSWMHYNRAEPLAETALPIRNGVEKNIREIVKIVWGPDTTFEIRKKS